uniref:Uncharacterized protein n=1 Tax=Panagrolaimus sp. ES5 TaxID=591445 RepID=A0AC34F8U1_9BILA
MDLSVDLQVATSSSSIQIIDEEIADDSKKVISPKKIYFTGPYRRQEWSLPDSIMYYMAMNPKSAAVYQKFVKSCKYFYIKNPILVASCLMYKKEKWQISCGKQTIDMSNVTPKLWITNDLNVSHYASVNPNLVSPIIQNIYKCDARLVFLRDQVISFGDFCFLTSNIEEFYFYNTFVKDVDGSIMEFEKLFHILSKAQSVTFNWKHSLIPKITSKTFDELLKIPHFATLKYLSLVNIPETFDLDAFYGYMKKNKLTTLKMYFSGAISEAYKNRIEEIIDEIISTKNHEYKVPLIRYSGIDHQKYHKLHQICFSH